MGFGFFQKTKKKNKREKKNWVAPNSSRKKKQNKARGTIHEGGQKKRRPGTEITKGVLLAE